MDRCFPAPGSSRSFAASTYVQTCVLMLLEGGWCLADVRHLKSESALLSLPEMNPIPNADALGHRMGHVQVGIRTLTRFNR